MATNTIAIARQQTIFAKLEATAGTLVFPAGTDVVVAAGIGAMVQQPSFTDSDEIVDSRDTLARFQDKYPPGDWSFPVYARPSGTAGTAPSEDVLMESLMGEKTVVGGTSVTYTLATTKPSFSMWMKKGHTVFFAWGCTVGALKSGLETKGGHKMEFSGQFMGMCWVGTDTISALAALGAASVVVHDAKKFSVGGHVEFVEGSTVYDATTGYAITAVNVATNTLTVSPVLEVALDAESVIRPYLPTASAVGTSLENRKGYAKLDTITTPLRSMNLNISDMPKYLDDEVTDDDFPTAYVETKRSIDGAIDVYFRENDLKYFYDGYNASPAGDIALQVIVGDAAGSIITYDMPTSSLSVPALEDADPTVALNMPYKALGSSGEDSISITYT
jgi:hypothetical protein